MHGTYQKSIENKDISQGIETSRFSCLNERNVSFVAICAVI